MPGSPRKRARRLGLDPDKDLDARSATARRDAETKAAQELTAWYAVEKARIRADESLGVAERHAAERALLMEFGRRSKKAIAKAKRDSSPRRLLEADARAEIEARRRGQGSQAQR